MRPIVINTHGFLAQTRGPIRVGTATQPYHAVSLEQVKKLLESIGGSFNNRPPFVASTLGIIKDSAAGFCLSEIGWFEALDYVYTGSVSSSMFIMAKTVMPSIVFVLQDTITLEDDTIVFTLSEVPWYETLDYIYTGKIVDVINSDDDAITPIKITVLDTLTFNSELLIYTLNDVSDTGEILGCVFTGTFVEKITDIDAVNLTSKVVATDHIAFNEFLLPYTLGDAMREDEDHGYIYAGTIVDDVIVVETIFSYESVFTADTMTLTPFDNGDVLYADIPADTAEQFPLDSLVLQKTKPKLTGEMKTMSDGAYGFIESKVNS
jgi:hypothetical protein